jgi:hypothetical protein
VSSHTLNHATDLTKYRASHYFARLPIRSAESGSLTLCAAHFLSLPSDPTVTDGALAIRIVFPLVRATPVSFNRPSLPTMPGKQKNRVYDDPVLLEKYLYIDLFRIFHEQIHGFGIAATEYFLILIVFFENRG